MFWVSLKRSQLKVTVGEKVRTSPEGESFLLVTVNSKLSGWIMSDVLGIEYERAIKSSALTWNTIAIIGHAAPS